jgi:hypothetical protein
VPNITKVIETNVPLLILNFVDTFGQVIKDTLLEDLLNAKYYSILMDGGTDSSVTGQELIYTLT